MAYNIAHNSLLSKNYKRVEHMQFYCMQCYAQCYIRVSHFVVCSVQAAFYVLFLTVLSYALIHGSKQDDPTHYSGKANGLRVFCEILTIIFLMFYFFEEVNQAKR